MQRLLLLLASAVILASSATAVAQDGRSSDADAVVSRYAATYGVGLGEAQQRLQRLREINDVEKKLTEKFPNQFGG